MMIYFLILIFAACSGACKAVQDKISFHWHTSIFSKIQKTSKLHNWLNPDYSWMNKWKENDRQLGEKFWGSSRWFVVFTDAWHLLDTLRIIFIIIAVALSASHIPLSIILIHNAVYAHVLDIIILYCVHSCVFEFLFSKFLSIQKIK